MTNILDDNFDTGIIISDISDHFPVFYVKHYIRERNGNIPFAKIRKMDEFSKTRFLSDTENTDWTELVNNFDPESAFNDFFSHIDKIFNDNFPEKLVKKRLIDKSKSPWMTEGLFESRRTKMKLYNKKVKRPSAENVKRYKEFNASYTKLIRKARHEYYNGKLKEFSKDAKKTWSTINEVLGRVKNVNDIPKRFISNGNVLSGSLEIAEGFNDFL